MHRDPTVRKRNALVIPGVLLALLCLTGILYAQALRGDDVSCEDGTMVVFAGACRSATLLLVIPLAISALLIGLGVRLRSHEPCHLGHGTTATTGLAVLIAVAVLPAIAALGLSLMEDAEAPYIITYNEVEYGQVALLCGLAALGFLLLLPYLLLYMCTARPARCCREKSCFEPCYCDEDTAAPVPTFPLAVTTPMASTVQETAQVTTTPWNGPPAREAMPLPPPDKVGLMRTRPDPTPVASSSIDEPKTLGHDAWPATAHLEPATTDDAATATSESLMPADDTPATRSKPAAKPKAKAKTTRKVTRKKSK